MPSQNRNSPIEVSSFTEQLKVKNRRRRETQAGLQDAMTTRHPARNDLAPALALVELPIDALRFPSRKVRALDEAHVQEIVRAISTLGFCAPILIGRDDLVLDGRSRIEAARRLGLVKVPCIRADHLSDDEQRLLRLAANRLGEKGRWDLDELKVEFEELIFAEAPIEVAGFTLDEIDQIVLNNDASAIEAGPLAPDPNAVAVARVGDVFRLGRHRLACGDATDGRVWRKVMEGDSEGVARLLLSDEPYNVKIKGHVSGSGHREFPMASGEMSDAQFAAFNDAWIGAALPWLCDGAVFGTFIDWRGYPTVHAAAVKAGLAPLNLVVWSKTNAGMGSLYRSQHELLPLFKLGSAPHVNNVALGKRGRWRSNLWTYAGASSLGSDARRGLQEHPTVKPAAMLEDAIIDLTHRDDFVLDPFLGSGSTLIACEKTARICCGLELDPLYVDVIVRRFEALTHKQALLEETGERFVDLAARRSRERGEFNDSGAAAPDGGAEHDVAIPSVSFDSRI
jgi:DNA modification methylase